MYVCEKKAPSVAPEYSDKTMGVRVSCVPQCVCGKHQIYFK
jgi:hypothetical protein